MTKTTDLVLVCELEGERPDDYIAYHRDAKGSLYETNNAASVERLTGREWLGWSHHQQREAITAMGNLFGDSAFAAVVASQSGCDWSVLSDDERGAVRLWNERYKR